MKFRTVETRFQNNNDVGHPNSMYMLHIQARFADAACCSEPLGDIPDIV
jgi:hypothetical protein